MGIDSRRLFYILNMNFFLCVVELVFLFHISIVETAEDIFSLKNNHVVYFFENCVSLCPESPEKRDPSTRELLRRADSTGPVSPTCNRFIRPKAGNAP
jgi:hypothetical protein